MNQDNIAEAPSLAEFLRRLEATENPANRHTINAYDLRLDPAGAAILNAKEFSGSFPIETEALADLARIVEVPSQFFVDKCEDDLRAFIYNTRLERTVPKERPLTVVHNNGAVLHVLDAKLLPVPRAPILRTLQNAIPEDLKDVDLKVIQHSWNGQFDVSVIAPSYHSEPQPGDTIAFGINISEGVDGAVQVHRAAFRYACRNGAIIRICDGRAHRIRRPPNRADRQGTFLRRVEQFARAAWRGWQFNADGLKRLKEAELRPEQLGSLESRLRQAPFFLSAGVAKRVLGQLAKEASQHGGATSMYDLWNAMTFAGTHESNLSATYRTRLRIGAGEFTRTETGICRECQQLKLNERHEDAVLP